MRVLRLIAKLAILAAPGAALAGGGLAVSPITIEIPPGTGMASTEVVNSGDAPMSVQVRAFDWSTDAAGDHHAPARGLGLSPLLFVLGPGERQVVRLGLTGPRLPDRETAYRLYVDQLPDPDASGLQMPVRLVLPVFVAPQDPPGRRAASGAGALAWRAERRGGQILLIAENRGARRVKLTELAWMDGERRRPIRSGLAGYVLAGSSLGWLFEPEGAAGRLDIVAATEEGEFRASVPLAE